MQDLAIKKVKGPCVILAGAGTGKTYTIVEKIKYLIENNIYSPEKIVCLTFSNEAANSLKERTLSIIKDKEPIIKTFHAFCADLLRLYGEKIGINQEFKILLPDDAKIMLHKNFKLQPNLCHKFINEIGIAKDLGITLESLENYLKNNLNEDDPEKKLESLQFTLQTSYLSKEKEELKLIKSQIESLSRLMQLKKLITVWKSYEKLKEKKNFLDYSDLNNNALTLLREYPGDYEYIIVDEFQDTNKVQCDFLELLAPHRNITIVGDLNQSIYRFRGAYKDNFSNFKKVFSIADKDIFNLDKSYRSTNRILRTAHELIQNNYENKEECFPVFSVHDKEGEKVKVFELKNNKEEIRKILEIIRSERDSGVPFNEICVMFRTHQQARSLKNALDYENIPYTSVTKKSLLKTTPVRITIDYLTILHKIKNKLKGGEQSWWDLIYLEGFSKEDSIILSRFIKESKEFLGIKILNEISSLNLSEQGKIKLRLLLTRIKDLIPSAEKDIPELMLRIYETTGLAYNETFDEDKERVVILKKFHELAQEYSSFDSPLLADFLHHLDVIKALGIEIEAPSLNKSGIKIMTHHSTKGLEYHTVILANMVQKKFPMEKINDSIIPKELSPDVIAAINDMTKEALSEYEKHNQLLEERRLCYVAFTRAKSGLYLTYAKEYNSRKFLPSQFLNEINYKGNNSIEFIQDNEEKYVEPKVEIKSAKGISLDKEIKFSPSALQIFDSCQKKYEYKYIYNMPQPDSISWEAVKIGSFTHLVFEDGVKSNFKEEKEFIDLARKMLLLEEWSSIDIEEVIPLVKVFYHRNKNKFSPKSMTEKLLSANLNGMKFIGIADRIDFHPDGIEIIDYKTGSSDIKPKYRNWQLGFYALAARNLGTPKRLTLDLLKKDKPLEFELDEKGNAFEIHSARTSFSLEEVKEELVSTAKQILECYQKGFMPCSPEKNCEFCNDYVVNS